MDIFCNCNNISATKARLALLGASKTMIPDNSEIHYFSGPTTYLPG